MLQNTALARRSILHICSRHHFSTHICFSDAGGDTSPIEFELRLLHTRKFRLSLSALFLSLNFYSYQGATTPGRIYVRRGLLVLPRRPLETYTVSIYLLPAFPVV